MMNTVRNLSNCKKKHTPSREITGYVQAFLYVARLTHTASVRMDYRLERFIRMLTVGRIGRQMPSRTVALNGIPFWALDAKEHDLT